MKKLLVSALVAAMVLGFGSMAFGAAGAIAPAAFSDIAGHEAEGELTYFFATGVFAGEGDGTVKPDDPLTRVAFCKVVVEAFGKGNMATALGGLRPNFVDEIPGWAWGYVNVATYMGVINGYEDGTFKANNFVTYGEAVTMLIRALPGHKGMVGAGVWPYNFIFYGVDNGFNGPVDVSFANLPCTRGDMARMLFATLAYVPTLVPGTGGAMVDDKTMLEDVLYAGTVTGASAAGLDLAWTGGSKSWATLADPVYIVGSDDYAGLYGLSVLAIENASDKPFFVWVQEDAGAFVGLFDSLVDSATDTDDLYDSLKFKDGTIIPFTGLGILTLNKAADMESLYYLNPNDECTVFTNEAGKATHVLGFRWNFEAVVSDDNDLDATTDPDTPAEIYVDGEWYDLPGTVTITLNGAGVDGDAVNTNDVVKLAIQWDYTDGFNHDTLIAVSAVRNVVEGKVTDTRTVYPGPISYATINGVEYKDLVGLAKGNTYKCALNHAGNIFHSVTVAAQTPFVHVVGYTSYGDGTAFATLNVRGETQTYAVANNVVGSGSLRDHIQAAASTTGPGEFGWIKIDPLTNTIVDWVEVVGWVGNTWQITANSGGNLTLYNGTTYDFKAANAGLVCYKTDGTYVAQADLGVGSNYTLRLVGTVGEIHDFDNVSETITWKLYTYAVPTT